MKPIAKINFGPDKMIVRFYDGTKLSTGHIVEQKGLRTYKVSNGTTTKLVKLATSFIDAEILNNVRETEDFAQVADLCTIPVNINDQTDYVSNLWLGRKFPPKSMLLKQERHQQR